MRNRQQPPNPGIEPTPAILVGIFDHRGDERRHFAPGMPDEARLDCGAGLLRSKRHPRTVRCEPHLASLLQNGSAHSGGRLGHAPPVVAEDRIRQLAFHALSLPDPINPASTAQQRLLEDHTRLDDGAGQGASEHLTLSNQPVANVGELWAPGPPPESVAARVEPICSLAFRTGSSARCA